MNPGGHLGFCAHRIEAQSIIPFLWEEMTKFNNWHCYLATYNVSAFFLTYVGALDETGKPNGIGISGKLNITPQNSNQSPTIYKQAFLHNNIRHVYTSPSPHGYGARTGEPKENYAWQIKCQAAEL